MSSIPSETPRLYQWTSICPAPRRQSPTKLSSLKETMTQPCLHPISRRQTTSRIITKDGRSPPPPTPFNGSPETPTAQWMDPTESPSQFLAPVHPLPPASPPPQSADSWKLGDTVRTGIEEMLISPNLTEQQLANAIAHTRLRAMQAQRISLKGAEAILPLCQVPEKGTGPWDKEALLLPHLLIDKMLL